MEYPAPGVFNADQAFMIMHHDETVVARSCEAKLRPATKQFKNKEKKWKN
jgi:hypothetical protein